MNSLDNFDKNSFEPLVLFKIILEGLFFLNNCLKKNFSPKRDKSSILSSLFIIDINFIKLYFLNLIEISGILKFLSDFLNKFSFLMKLILKHLKKIFFKKEIFLLSITKILLNKYYFLIKVKKLYPILLIKIYSFLNFRGKTIFFSI